MTTPMRPNETVSGHFHTTPEGHPAGGTIVFKTTGQELELQNGIVGPDGRNGIILEEIILAAILRLEWFNESDFRCRENSLAITKLEEALAWLKVRTENREAQDTENSYETHKS